jgi:hypothetical protein
MTVIKHGRFGADRMGPEKQGPELYAPQRNTPPKLGDIEEAANPFEGEVREFARRDVGGEPWPRDLTPNAQPNTDHMNALIKRVASASVEEIDRVILELHGVREMLRGEGERVSREIATYASLSQAAMTAMKVIGDSLTQWKNAPSRSASRAAE